MKSKKKIRFLITIFILIFISSNPLLIQAKETDTQKKVVKVAYLLSPGYQEGGEGEYKSGQGYEYLQKIASYTGWTYEYVYGDFGELMQKLIDGEVDIMGNISYTDERAQLMSYGKYEQGRETFYLYVNGSDFDIVADDYTSLNGKKIGVSKDSYQENEWKKWCVENNVQCDLVEFTSKDERETALNTGTIDATIGSFLPNRDANTYSWRSVFAFGDAPYYFVVNSNRTELLDELNRAQGKILNDDPYYNEELIKRYLPNGTLSQSQLDNDEINWLEKHTESVKIGCLDNFLPISDIDEDGKARGILIDVIAEIMENFQYYNISYEMKIYEDYDQMIKDLKSGVIDVAAPIYGDYWYADKEGISLTNPFMTTTMLQLQYGNQSIDSMKRIGIVRQNQIQMEYAQIHYPDSEQIFYSNMEDVAKAVKKGEIDGGLSTACNYHVNAIMYSDLGDLNRSTLPNDIDITMAVAKGNSELMSLINRGIYSIGDTVVYNSMAKNSNIDKKITFMDYISKNPKFIIIASCIIVGFALAIIIVLMNIVVKLRHANKRASVDSMTGLLNKISMSDRVKEELKHGGVFFMFDIDDFKSINDGLGHENGDKVIIHFANCLQQIFRNEDLIGRFGGDEFMVFLQETEIDEKIIMDKITQLQNAMTMCEVLNENKEIIKGTISIGAIIVNANNNYTYAEVFQQADDALYEAKNNGKNTYVMRKY